MLDNIETQVDKLLMLYDKAIKGGNLSEAEEILKNIEMELSKLDNNEIKLITKQIH